MRVKIMSYQGSCHCGAVKYNVNATIDKTMECNCSICSRKGHLMAFITQEQFELLQGAEALSDYQFAKKHLHHRFCKNCGIGTFSHGLTPEGKQMYAVNVRCLENFNFQALPIEHHDGRSLS